MAVLVPVYWYYYGPTNFLYFCDVALFLTLAGIWLESPLLVSMCAVGIVAPQTLWCIDFLLNLFGVPLVGMTDYMFKHENSLFLRGLSLFHGWIPFLLLYLVWKLGYDRRALVSWTVLAWALILICFFFMPPPHPNPRPHAGQHQLRLGTERQRRADLRASLRLGARPDDRLPLLLFLPMHLLLMRFAPKPAATHERMVRTRSFASRLWRRARCASRCARCAAACAASTSSSPASRSA